MMDWDWVDWFPIVVFPLKILVLGTGMFFAIKWHHDQAKNERKTADRKRPPNMSLAPRIGRSIPVMRQQFAQQGDGIAA